VKFEGVFREDWEYKGLVHPAWMSCSLTFDTVQRNAEGNLAVTGKMVTYELLRECAPEAEGALRREVDRIHVHRADAGNEAILEGEYDVNHAMLTLKTTKLTALHADAAWHYLQFKMKVFPDYMKGIAESMPEKLDRMVIWEGGSREVNSRQYSAPGQDQASFLTLKRVLS